MIIATGPLTSPALSLAIQGLTGEGELAFFDAIAPVVHFETIDQTIAWKQSRYDKDGPAGTGADYFNCPMNREEYEAFIDALISAEKTSFKEWEAIDALLRRLPAGGSDGRARTRDVALWPDEARRPR